jgi:hypothetical protein
MYDALSRAQRIVLELSNALNHKANPELCERLAALYTYIYRRLVDTNIEREVSAVDEAIKLLDFERETWVMAMKKMATGEDPVPAASTAPGDDLPNPIATIGRAAPAPAPAAIPASPAHKPNPFARPAAPRAGFTAQG